MANTTLPKPKSWEDFENEIRELFVYILDDPNTQKNGRSGQPQCGVDIYGRRNGKHYVGIQCKKKYSLAVTEKELRSEVEKAKTFKPKIKEFFLVTTAPRDQKIQEVARIVTEELKNSGNSLHVFVWGWDDIEENAVKYYEPWKAFDPTWNPVIEFHLNKIYKEIQEIKRLPQEILPSSNTLNSVNQDQNNENTPLHGEITTLQRLIDDGYAKTALCQLEKLKNEKWANASRSERYRILVCYASANLKLDNLTDAANFLIDAYSECPEHKNAKKNLATGYLLKNDYEKAIKLSLEMLEEDNNNDKAAGVLIQALISDSNCNDPLMYVPKGLHEEEEVLFSYTHFHRCRGNYEWVNHAKIGITKFPDNKLFKIFYAEAVLTEIIEKNSDITIGGISKSIKYKDLIEAGEVLYLEARDAIDKGYTLRSSIANNAVVALRLSNDILRAKEILDFSLKLYPDDENLRLQRALVALSENDPDLALTYLPSKSKNPEVIGLIARILVDTNKPDEALFYIESANEDSLSKNIEIEYLAIRLHAYTKRGEKQLAIDSITQCIISEPNNLTFRILKIRIFRIMGNENDAVVALKEALSLVNDQTNLFLRLALCFEAKKLNSNNIIINLLKGHVATDHESEGLHYLITASIDGGFWATAREILDSIPKHLKNKDWFVRAKAVLAFNTGDVSADKYIGHYLKQCPNDLNMTLIRIGIWQKEGRDKDIKHLLQRINLSDVDGQPEQCIKLANMICLYENVSRGIQYAYSVLMDNWKNFKAHLAYQGLIFFNNKLECAIPTVDKIEMDTVACLLTATGEKRYRIEKNRHKFFEDEHVEPDSDLEATLLGKKKGEKFLLQEHIGAKHVEVCWVKSIYIDAFHRSLDEFNERFPHSNGLLRFEFDKNASDPLENIKEITKAHAEHDQCILDEYNAKQLPLSFTSTLLGKDPVDVMYGLPSVNIKLHVCSGFIQEREEAQQTIQRHEKKGCLLDAITLSVVHRLGVEKAISAVCGPIYTTQSVIDLFITRAMEAKLSIGKKQGFLSWREGRLVYEGYTEEFVRNMANEREKEATWVKEIAAIATSIPKKDFSPEVKIIIDKAGNIACDPAIAAYGNDLLLLSEDMGFRIWSKIAFNISTTWLQPVLMHALRKGYLAIDEYSEATNSLVFYGHTYVSLDANCLMYEARRSQFLLKKELSSLLEMAGGILADIRTNTDVLASFIDMLLLECPNELKAMRIVSEVFRTFTKGRHEDQRAIVGLIFLKVKNRNKIKNHTLNWLIGHSIGMPYFYELINKKMEI